MLKPAQTMAVIIVLSITALALATWGATYLPSYRHCKQYGVEQNTGANQGNPKKLTAKWLVTVTDNTLFDCEGVAADRNGGAITAVATVLLTVVTGLLGFIAYLQFIAARNQARPYVFVLAKGIEGWAPDGPLRIKVVMENYGATPAYDVEWAGIASIEAIPVYREKKFLRKAQFMTFPPNIPHSVSPLAKEPFWSVDEIEASEFTPEVIASIYAGQLGIYSYSTVRHKDVFGAKYVVESCHYIALEDVRAMIDERRGGKTCGGDHMHILHAHKFNRMN